MKISRLVIAWLLLLMVHISFANELETLEQREIIHGKYRHEYANEWRQWAYSMPKKISAVRDTTGGYRGVNQDAPV